MMIKNVVKKYLRLALPLLGSAFLLYSCDDGTDAAAPVNEDTLMTEQSENLSVIMSENGRKSYFFKTPLLEGYTLARDPYREFRKGIDITTYQDDSMSTVNANLTANYAIYYENRKLWEAKGDVVVVKADGTELYTQQLFWNSMTKRIYSNVDTKIVKGTDVFFGEGFESDEELKQWKFRRMSGRMFVKMVPSEDSEDTEGEEGGENTEKTESGEGDVKAAESVSESVKEPVEKAPAAVEKPQARRAARPETERPAKRERVPVAADGNKRPELNADRDAELQVPMKVRSDEIRKETK